MYAQVYWNVFIIIIIIIIIIINYRFKKVRTCFKF